MRVYDWRTAATPDLDDAFAAEILRWHDMLGWDASESWQMVDAARRSGALPGFVVEDVAGEVAGWTYYLRHGQELQIGALNATNAQQTEALLDAILGSSLADEATSAVFFSFSTAADLERLLTLRGFDTEKYLYLERSTAGVMRGPEGASWRESMSDAVAALLASSYDNARSRPFARDGGLDGWRHYVAQLVSTIGCGSFLPECCQLVEAEDGRVSAAVLTTRLSEQTAHLAQVVVDPLARGRSMGARLVTAAMAAAHDSGFARATLLVGERNQAARRIYDELGFREVAAFVSATCDQPRRLSSVALDTGGAITLR